MDKTKLDALVPCGEDGMGALAREASFVPNMEAYSSFQLDKGPGAYNRAFLTHRNDVTTAVKRVARKSCTTEKERKEVLQADLERNVTILPGSGRFFQFDLVLDKKNQHLLNVLKKGRHSDLKLFLSGKTAYYRSMRSKFSF